MQAVAFVLCLRFISTQAPELLTWSPMSLQPSRLLVIRQLLTPASTLPERFAPGDAGAGSLLNAA